MSRYRSVMMEVKGLGGIILQRGKGALPVLTWNLAGGDERFEPEGEDPAREEVQTGQGC